MHTQSTGKTALLRRLPHQPPRRLGINTQQGIVVLSLHDILFCEAMSNYCRIHLRGGVSHVISKPMKRVHALLPQSDFIRTHQSYIVRIDEIVLIGQEVGLANGVTVPLARSQRTAVLSALQHHLTMI